MMKFVWKNVQKMSGCMMVPDQYPSDQCRPKSADRPMPSDHCPHCYCYSENNMKKSTIRMINGYVQIGIYMSPFTIFRVVIKS
jgi:hypothetical protein